MAWDRRLRHRSSFFGLQPVGRGRRLGRRGGRPLGGCDAGRRRRRRRVLPPPHCTSCREGGAAGRDWRHLVAHRLDGVGLTRFSTPSPVSASISASPRLPMARQPPLISSSALSGCYSPIWKFHRLPSTTAIAGGPQQLGGRDDLPSAPRHLFGAGLPHPDHPSRRRG